MVKFIDFGLNGLVEVDDWVYVLSFWVMFKKIFFRFCLVGVNWNICIWFFISRWFSWVFCVCFLIWMINFCFFWVINEKLFCWSRVVVKLVWLMRICVLGLLWFCRFCSLFLYKIFFWLMMVMWEISFLILVRIWLDMKMVLLCFWFRCRISLCILMMLLGFSLLVGLFRMSSFGLLSSVVVRFKCWYIFSEYVLVCLFVLLCRCIIFSILFICLWLIFNIWWSIFRFCWLERCL